MQESELDKNPEYAHHYIICMEELQNSFGTYSMNSDDSLDLMTCFTQSRSDALIHYIGIGQRLNDISTKVIERLRPLIGLTLGENSLRKIKSQLPDNLKQRVQQLPQRHWIYLDGKTNPEIVIPEYKKEGSAIQLRPQVDNPQPQKPKKQGFLTRLKYALFPSLRRWDKRIEAIKREHTETTEKQKINQLINQNEDEESEETEDWLESADNPDSENPDSESEIEIDESEEYEEEW